MIQLIWIVLGVGLVSTLIGQWYAAALLSGIAVVLLQVDRNYKIFQLRNILVNSIALMGLLYAYDSKFIAATVLFLLSSVILLVERYSK